MTRTLPLAGIRVIEFSHMIMGPSCGLILADLGADVIKVEPAGAGDNTRRLTGSGIGFFVSFNRNKRSVTVDMKSCAGLAFVKKLIGTADVVIENFRPGALAKLGLDYPSLKAVHPRLIYGSLKGFLSGPYEHRAALDEVVQMMGGLAYMTGPPGRPLRAGASVNDIMGGMFGVIGILAALQERHATGLGKEIKAGLFENNVLLMATHMMQYAITGIPAAPMPNRISAWAVYDVFDTAGGGQIFVGVVTDTQWAAFCDAFELPEFKTDPDCKTNSRRVSVREKFMPRLREMIAQRQRVDVAALCESIGLPYAQVMRPQDLLDDPHVSHPGAMTEISLPDGRKTKSPALPLELDGQRLGLYREIPRAGEHLQEIARELGLDDADIAALRLAVK